MARPREEWAPTTGDGEEAKKMDPLNLDRSGYGGVADQIEVFSL